MYETGSVEDFAQKENIAPREMRGDSKKPPVSYSNNSNKTAVGGIPLLRRARSALSKRPGTADTRASAEADSSDGNKSSQPSRSVSPNPGSDRQVAPFHGGQSSFQVSITAEKPKKATLAERAAKFGGQKILRSVSRKGSGSTEPPPVRYTVVRSPSTKLSRTAPSRRKVNASPERSDETGETRRVGSSDWSESAAPVRAITPPFRLQVPDWSKSGSQQSKPGFVPSRKPVSVFREPTSSHFNSDRLSPSSSCSSSESVVEQTDEEREIRFDGFQFPKSEGEMYPGKPGYIQTQTDIGDRFSWMTKSPPISPPPTSPGDGDSIMSRRRPLPAQSLNPERPTSRKSSTVSTAAKDSDQETLSPVLAKDKALPPPPAAEPPRSRMEELQAKSDELDLRMSNIKRVLREVEEVDKASPLEVTEKMRRANRKRMEAVRTALEDARREKHEVGCALARTYAKIQKEEGIQSALWVYRVTEE